MVKINKIALMLVFAVVFNVFAYSQGKSLVDAESEIKTFKNFESFSVTYNDRKDLTTATVTINIRNDDKALKKPFKKFVWEIASIYSGIAIDDRPVRNVLCIKTQSKGFRFARSNSLVVRLPDEKVDFGVPNRFTEAKGRRVKEHLCWDITKEIIGDLAKAGSINFQVGSVSSSIPRSKLQLFKDYAKLLDLGEK